MSDSANMMASCGRKLTDMLEMHHLLRHREANAFRSPLTNL